MAVTGDGTARLLRQLDDGIAQLERTDEWRRWLAMAAHMSGYSFGNLLLIGLQRPDATNVAGYRRWCELGRHVRRGEKGIAILAPMVRRVRDDDGDGDGDERVVTGFRVVHVFDIRQTDGEPLPDFVRRMDGDDGPQLTDCLRSLAIRTGYGVEFREKVPGGPEEANGMCSHVDRMIIVRSGNSPAQRAKTLAHELAHAMMHDRRDGWDGPRARAECEAESVAYVVMAAHGIDSGEYSFGYVANWAGDGDGNASAIIKASGARICATASRILDGIRESGLAAA